MNTLNPDWGDVTVTLPLAASVGDQPTVVCEAIDWDKRGSDDPLGSVAFTVPGGGATDGTLKAELTGGTGTVEFSWKLVLLGAGETRPVLRQSINGCAFRGLAAAGLWSREEGWEG